MEDTGRFPKNTLALDILTLSRFAVSGWSRYSPRVQARNASAALLNRVTWRRRTAALPSTTILYASASTLLAAVLLRSVASKSRTLLNSSPFTQKRYSHFPFLLRIGIVVRTPDLRFYPLLQKVGRISH